MRSWILLLALLGGPVLALGPQEVYERAAPATVYVLQGASTASGVVLDAARGWVLTTAEVTGPAARVEIRLRDDRSLAGEILVRDTELNLALLKVAGLKEAGVSALPSAPPIRTAREVVARRVYAIGHPADREDALGMWKFSQGLVSEMVEVAELDGLRLLQHDATPLEGNAGGPLLDSKARLLGIHMGGWSKLADVGDDLALPINAIHAFLAGTEARNVFGKQPDGGLPVRAPKADPGPEGAEPGPPRDPVPGPPARDRPAPDPVPRVSVPRGLDYGVYQHLIESRERVNLKRRAQKLLQSLRGLHLGCRTCKGTGSIVVTLREGYWQDRHTWIPPLTETRTCPTCKGERLVFRRSIAERTYRSFSRSRDGLQRFVDRAKSSRRTYLRQVAIKAEVNGLSGVVRGARNNPLFPLHFRLLRDGKKYEWFLSDESLEGTFRGGSGVPGTARIAEAASADILVLEDGTVVRLCGIVVPDAKGKAPKRPVAVADEGLRAIAREELVGKTVTLTRDKYADLTCGGLPLVFVELEGRDFGEELLRRGLVRRHTRHKHARNVRYMKTESAAKKAKVGIWTDD